MTSQHDLASIARAAPGGDRHLRLPRPDRDRASGLHDRDRRGDDPGELPASIEVFSARSQSLGSKPWTPEEVCAPAPLRLDRASVSELFVIDRDDRRMRTEIEG